MVGNKDEAKTLPAIRKLRSLLTPKLIVLAVCLSLVSLNIVLVQRSFAYNSDDVSWQTILATWSPFSGQKAYMGGKDNFIINLPFVLLADHLAGPGRTQLLIASLLMAAVNFTLFYLSSVYFLKKSRVAIGYRSLTPFIWLASFGVALSSLFLNTVWRDYEIGVSFAYYALAAKYYFGEIRPFENRRSKLLTVLWLLVSGGLVQSDPYFFYFTVLPVATFFGIQYLSRKVSKYKLIMAMSWSLTALVIAKVLTSVVARVGILEGEGKVSLNGLSDPWTAFGQLFNGLLYMFGISQNGSAWRSLANLAPLIIIVGLVAKQLWSKRVRHGLSGSSWDAWVVFFVAVMLSVASASLIVSESGAYSYRYLVLVVYLAVLLLAVKASTLTGKLMALVVVVLLVASFSNVAASYASYRSSADEAAAPNAANLQIIAAVQNLGLTKGYAGYWDGSINTYLSQNVNFLPVTCHLTKTVPLRLLVNGALFSQPASRTFLVLDPGMNPPVCSSAHVIAQFGQPAQRISISNKTILIYNYDLASKMQ